MDCQTPVRRGRWAVAKTDEAGAETLLSTPMETCRSPNANIMASRALLRAMLPAADCPEERSEILDRVSKPTAITVSRIIKLSVTISAKPDSGVVLGFVFMAKK